eukprot:CAMPEP_0177234644 /NCGR_PEP_ID=MMETSP0367-20130122/44502_1 /TAXON_ID=447022 ORGANISM="Scrippsiella hangoei-like, Strain SHHI-4" /NCGR_SAMPLE_ID=MMETSP0367 /ASSEMBLY_ACC=CAM_ASM_000362 /LENGTH=61 /DNA_ID=CAMNT_0018685443 /DNA_START=358 /DNA_END=540 /DNA_ORIENTATION=-
MKPSISLRTETSAPLSSDAAGREASIAQATSIHVGVGGPQALGHPRGMTQRTFVLEPGRLE